MLRENQKLSRAKGDTSLAVDDVVIVYDKHQPRHLWKLARVIELTKGRDDIVRGAKIKFGSTGAETTRPLNLWYPLEIRKSHEKTPSDSAVVDQKSEYISEKDLDTDAAEKYEKKVKGRKTAPTADLVSNRKNIRKDTKSKRKAGVIGEQKRRNIIS